MTKTFNIHAQTFPQIAITMNTFEKVYKDSIDTMSYGKMPTIVLKEDGGVVNIFRFSTSNMPGAMDIKDFIKHYFPREKIL